MRFGLERMRRLLTALGSPQERFAAIHVVGTNGKSSTVRMTAALLEAHGVRTGAYLSPHLVRFAERDPDRRRGPRRRRVRRRGRARRGGRREGRPHAHRRRARDAVRAADRRRARRAGPRARSRSRSSRPASAGAGTPPTCSTRGVCVLTNVGLEHTRWLGPTVADIAREKLAVVRPDATLVLGEVDAEVRGAGAGDRRADRARRAARRAAARLPAHELRGRRRRRGSRAARRRCDAAAGGRGRRARAACRAGCRSSARIR